MVHCSSYEDNQLYLSYILHITLILHSNNHEYSRILMFQYLLWKKEVSHYDKNQHDKNHLIDELLVQFLLH